MPSASLSVAALHSHFGVHLEHHRRMLRPLPVISGRRAAARLPRGLSGMPRLGPRAYAQLPIPRSTVPQASLPQLSTSPLTHVGCCACLALASWHRLVRQAFCAPAAYTLIADIFPKNKVASMNGIYGSAVYLGGVAFVHMEGLHTCGHREHTMATTANMPA